MLEEKSRLKIEENKYGYTEKNNDLPNEPMQAICEYCGKQVTTYVKTEFNLLLFPTAVVLLIVYGFWPGLFLSLIILFIFQNLIHYCPECMSELAFKSFYPIENQLNHYIFIFGRCTLIIRKMFVYLFIVFIVAVGIFINVKYYSSANEAQIKETEKILLNVVDDEKLLDEMYKKKNADEITWENLIEDCGAKVIVENSARAVEIFQRKYLNTIVEWKGYFINTHVNMVAFGIVDANHAISINIRMIPSESLKDRDLELILSIPQYNELLPTLKKMRTGTPLLFKGEITAMGSEWAPHHLHYIDVKIIDDFMQGKVNFTIFKGVNFDIKGHLENAELIQEYEKEGKVRNVTNEGEEE